MTLTERKHKAPFHGHGSYGDSGCAPDSSSFIQTGANCLEHIFTRIWSEPSMGGRLWPAKVPPTQHQDDEALKEADRTCRAVYR